MIKNLLIVILGLFLLFGCSSKEDKELKIVTNSWIGYAPLFYAKESGYLDNLGIKLITTVSLEEAFDIFSVGKADLVTTTQHEYYALKKTFNSIKPVILIDRSLGGDMIMSNISLDELKNANKIDVFLEIDSINSEILKTFIKKYKLDISKMNFIDGDQSEFQDIKNDKSRNILIVTYSPYNEPLNDSGFMELVSTKDLDSIIVIDSICATDKIINKYPDVLKKLKNVIDQSIFEIENNKKDAYKKVSRYLNNISYEEFLASLKKIRWINTPSDDLLNRIEPLKYKREYLIK